MSISEKIFEYRRIRVAQGASTYNSKTADGDSAGWWWLRSPSDDQLLVAFVNTDGSLSLIHVGSDTGCVRPALWVNLDSGIF